MSNYNNNNIIIIISHSLKKNNSNNITTTTYIEIHIFCVLFWFLQFCPLNYYLLNLNNSS